MSNKLARAVAILGAGMAGYARGQREREERQRLEEERAFQREQRERMRQQWADEDRLKADLKDAAAPRSPESAEVYQPSVDDEGNAMPANPTAGTYKIDDQFSPTGRRLQTYAGLAEATQAAQQANTPQARRARMTDVLAARDPLKAEQLRAQGLQTDLQAAQLQEATELQGYRQFARAATGSLLNGGWGGFAKFATEQYNDGNTYEAVEDGKGGAVMVAKRDGREIGRQAFASPEDAIMYATSRADPTKWVEYQGKKRETAKADERYEAEQAENKRRWDATHNIAVAQERRAAQAAARAAEAEAKLPPAVKMQYTALQERAKAINAALTKAQAEGMWQPDSPGARQLMTDLAAIDLEMGRLLAPYLKQEGAGGADPLGLFDKEESPSPRTAAPTPAPAAAPAPAPARRPAPPGSPQARWEERQASMRAAAEAARAERERANAQAQAEFEAAVQSLPPLELLRKYPDMASRRALSREQLARLREIEQSVR